MTTNVPTNSDDVIDSRDVIARIAELESLADTDEDFWDLAERNAEHAALVALAEEASSTPDWQFGETLIRDSYFIEYAQELAEDIGAINSDAGWPTRCIDWKLAAEELQEDYFSVEFDGVTYWIHS